MLGFELLFNQLSKADLCNGFFRKNIRREFHINVKITEKNNAVIFGTRNNKHIVSDVCTKHFD